MHWHDRELPAHFFFQSGSYSLIHEVLQRCRQVQLVLAEANDELAKRNSKPKTPSTAAVIETNEVGIKAIRGCPFSSISRTKASGD